MSNLVALRGNLELVEATEATGSSKSKGKGASKGTNKGASKGTSKSKGNRSKAAEGGAADGEASAPAEEPTAEKKQNQVWQWKGVWAFGTHILDLPNSHRRQLIQPQQPFCYTWTQAVDPSSVQVPSSVAKAQQQQEEGDDDVNQAGAIVLPASTPAAAASAAVRTTAAPGADADTAQSTQPPLSSSTSASTSTQDQSQAASGVANTADSAEATLASKQAAPAAPTAQEDGAKHQTDTRKQAASTTNPTASAGTTTASTNAMQHQQQQQSEAKEASSRNGIDTFADVPNGEPPFTDASQQLPHKCPPAGKFVGHFENAVPTKSSRGHQSKAKTQRIEEYFYLFINATPGISCRTRFPDQGGAFMHPAAGGNRTTSTSSISASNTMALHKVNTAAGIVHVRGMGENPFGQFELVGSFDTKTGVLECQRQYILFGVTPAPKRRRRASAESYATSAGALSTSSSKSDQPYFTRKRRSVPSWKRKPDDDFPASDARRMKRSKSIDSTMQPSAGTLSAPANLTTGVAAAAMAGDADNKAKGAQSSPAKLNVISADQKHKIVGSGSSSGTHGVSAHGGKWIRSSKSDPSITTSSSIAGTPASKAAQPQVQSGGQHVGGAKKNASISKTPQKKPSSSHKPSGSTPPAAPATTAPAPAAPANHMELPLCGEPKMARWRSAHFLYYHRPQPDPDANAASTTDPQATNNAATSASDPSAAIAPAASTPALTTKSTAAPTASSGTAAATTATAQIAGGTATGTTTAAATVGAEAEAPPAKPRNDAIPEWFSPDPNNKNDGTGDDGSKKDIPKYLVYEGEMVECMREGRGICLYSNDVLYEGDWKRNKEHGKGALMSSDRKRMIYRGDFERGRLQGVGAYYYHSSHDDSKDDDDSNAVLSRYEGDFRENMRHGHGKYVLPDGSEYTGKWKEGTMNGRGIFTWSDGSMYDGEWKDGKRHGNGLLKVSDGFVYDGTWVNNAMEGRGSAIYPNGQRYDGLFSHGRREGRGTIYFANDLWYSGRFRDDAVDGQGTMKMSRTMAVPQQNPSTADDDNDDDLVDDDDVAMDVEKKQDFMIPVSFQSDISHIHAKAGFTAVGD